MTSIGDTLRRERLRRNLDLAAIAGELKIASKFLEAIEAEEFSRLPGGVFTKSFIRQYAAYLGLDGDEMAAELQRSTEPPPELNAAHEKSKPDVPVIPMTGEDDWRSVSGRRSGMPAWLQAGALLVVLMGTCSGLYWLWERPRHQVLAVELPPSHVAAPAPTPPATAPPENPPVAAAAPSEVTAPTQTATEQLAATPVSNPPAAAGTASPAFNPNAPVRVEITADEPVWIRTEVNGKYEYEGTLQAHETHKVSTDGVVRLRLGNAGGVSISLNGKAIDPVGPKGQIRTVQFTSGGFQIVSPAKSDPLDRL